MCVCVLERAGVNFTGEKVGAWGYQTMPEDCNALGFTVHGSQIYMHLTD